MKVGHLAVIGALASLMIHGCSEPGPLMTVTPPGAMIPKTSPDADPAQAVGEAAGSVNSAAPKTPETTKSADSKPTVPAKPVDAAKTASTPANGKLKTSPLGVKYEILKEGSGPEAKSGDRVAVHYVGTLENGQQFDSSRPRGEPFVVPLGAGRVIQGWDDGIPGMKVGELRRLIIPSDLGYGPRGSAPSIPPNATLIFEVELLRIN